uniref:Malectin n=1 Tax=Eptatretus burgeri TaxID=7764 RepID=A0A8C4N8Q9_EPTBU
MFVATSLVLPGQIVVLVLCCLPGLGRAAREAHGGLSSGLGSRVLWAVNAGGGVHVGAHGIRYRADPLNGKIGVASDYGTRLPIMRAWPLDQLLYQTERWSDHSFGYSASLPGEGAYTLVLKFAEVYFLHSQAKVFDIRLNGMDAISNLDIFSRAGPSTAHDELLPFSVSGGRLFLGDREGDVPDGPSAAFNGKLHIEFVKGEYDNPKICAMYIIRGLPQDVPPLPPLPSTNESPQSRDGDKRIADDDEDEGEDEEEVEDEEVVEEEGNKKESTRQIAAPRLKRVTETTRRGVESGPRVPDPYASDNGSLTFPVLVAFGVFIPTLFCLCRL